MILRIKGIPQDPYHKHWFTRKEWILKVLRSGFKIVFHHGIDNIIITAFKPPYNIIEDL